MDGDSPMDVEEILEQLNKAADKRKEAETVLALRLADLKEEFGISTIKDAEKVLKQMQAQQKKLEKEYREKYDGLAALYL